ncbi:MAG: hypothetical protein L0207_03635 [Chlamydiae bacterium]|nr:hypothetical protein [Chlamydiota bacterium]
MRKDFLFWSFPLLILFFGCNNQTREEMNIDELVLDEEDPSISDSFLAGEQTSVPQEMIIEEKKDSELFDFQN